MLLPHEQRLEDLARAAGLKLDAKAAVAAVSLAMVGFTEGTHTVIPDDELLPVLQELADRPHTAAAPVVHPANRHLVGQHPTAFLAALGALPFDKMAAGDRITAWRQFSSMGHIGSTPRDDAAATRAEYDARALHALDRGEGASMDADGNLSPANLSAVDKLKLARATGTLPPPKAGTAKPLTEAEMPAQFRHLKGAAKLDALGRVKSADVARAALDAHAAGQPMSAEAVRRARETVILGGGGSVRKAS